MLIPLFSLSVAKHVLKGNTFTQGSDQFNRHTIKLNIMTTNTNEQIASYIINTCKSVGKDINYALDIVEWYTMTTSQDNEVKRLISANFK